MEKIAFISPVGNEVPVLTFQSALSMCLYAQTHDIEITHIGVTYRMLVDDARNTLADQFLKTDAQWAFWFDSDMTAPKDTIVKLLKLAKDKETKMTTGVYYQRVGKHWPVLWSRDVESESGVKIKHTNMEVYNTNEYLGSFTLPGPECKDPFPVHAAGFGCTLIHREVFEKMNQPWFKFIKGTCSEDFYFFVNAKKLGYQLWADPTIDLGHIGTAPVITKKDCYEWLTKNDGHVEAIKIKGDKNGIDNKK